MRNPPRKIAAPASSHTGHTVAPGGERLRAPIQTQRASSHTRPGYASTVDAKTCAWLKNHSETENETSTSRARFRNESGRRQSTRPSRKRPQKLSQIV